MLKFLRTFAMTALLLMPFAMQAQNSTLTVCNGTVSNEYVPFQGWNADAAQHNQLIYPADSLTAMNGQAILQMVFHIDQSASNGTNTDASRLGTWTVSLGETTATTLSGLDNTTTLTQVYQGYFDCSTGTLTLEFDQAYMYNGGNLLVDLNHAAASYNRWYFLGVNATGASYTYNSQRDFLPKCTFTYGAAPTCFRVTNLAIDATATTANSLTLTWTDALNTGATYSVYDMSDTSILTSGLTATTYTVTGLTANTPYSFGIQTDCGGGDIAEGHTTVSGRTACAAASLPYTCGFEANEIQSTTQATALPWCSQRYVTPGATSGTSYPYSYASYAHNGSRSLYFYGTTSTSYPAQMALILPEVDVTSHPMNGNRISFWAKMSSTSYNKDVIVATLSDPTDITTLTAIDTVQVTGTTHTKYTVSLASATPTDAYVVLIVNRGSGSLYLDDLTLEEMPACLEVTGLTASNITTTGVTLSWTDTDNPAGTTYSVYDMSDTSLVESALTSTTYNVTGLTANTAYVFGVRANCTSGDAPYITIAIRTACEANTVFPWSDDFESYTASSSGVTLNAPCWVNEHITGGGSSLFQVYSSTSGMSGNTTKMLRLPDMTSGTQTKLVLPAMDLPTGSSYQFVIDVLRNTTSYASEGVRVYASTDGEITGATELGFLYRNYTQTDNGVVGAETASGWYTYEFTIPFTGTCYIILRGESSYGAATYMDNFIIREVPSCLAVTALTAGNITDNSMTLTWTDGVNTGATYSVYDMSDTTLVADNITGTTYTVTNLTANTEYTFGVVANCSATDNSYFTTVSGRTACGVETMPWSENFDSWTAKSPCWAFLSGAYNMGAGTPTTSSSAWTLNTSYGDYITISGKALTMNIYSTNRYWAVTPSIEMTGDAMFSVDVAVAAWSAATPAYDADDTLAIAISNNNGLTWTNLRVLNNTELNALSGTYTTINVPVNGYTGDTVRFAVFGGSSASGGDNRIAIDNFSVTEMSANFCYPVTNVVVDSVTATSVFLSWADTNNTGATYSVYSLTTTDTTFIADGISVTNYEVTNLTASTNYTFAVVTNCSATDSSTMVTVGARTDCLGGSCQITIYAQDGYGDGWGSDLVIAQNGATVATYSMADQGLTSTTIYDTFSVNVCSGLPVTFTWVSGGPYAYDDEASFTIVDGGNGVVYTCADASMLTDGAVFATAADPCPSCNAPVLTVDAATTTSVTISWTGNAASYSVYLDSVFVANVTTNTYTFTGLTAATIYNFGVASICSATDSSSIATIAANTACNTFAIPFVENFEPEGNEVCWTIHATSTGTTFTTGSGNYVVNGTGLFAFFYSENPPQYLISPELTGTGNGVEMSFSYRVYSATYPESFMVGYSTTTNDTSAFVWSTEQTNLANTTYDRYVENLTAAGIKYVAIKYTANDMYALLIDSLVVRDIPTCDPVTALTASNVTNNSVTLNWTGTAASYDVYNGTTMVANVTTNTYTFTGLTAATAYTFGVQALCSATDSADMVTVAVSTACDDITTLPYNEGFEAGLGCWTSVNGSADGVDWNAQPAFSSGSITPHTGNYMAASWSWNGSEIDANAWLISPKFVLPTVNAGDSLTFSWWARTNHSYPDSYSVVLSNTTSDTAAFTNVIRPYAMADTSDTWVLHTVDLSAYAGQSVYIAFHHVDYDNNYLLIDDIALSQGGYVPPAPDTLTVTFAVDDATMGTTIPAPGTYQYFSGDSVFFGSQANAGYRFLMWEITFGTGANAEIDTFDAQYANGYYILADRLMSYGAVAFKAFFEAGRPDSTTITYAVNDPSLGSITPAAGTHTIYVGDTISASATAYTGAVLTAWVYDIIRNGSVLSSDTITSDDPEFTNPISFGVLSQLYITYEVSLSITAIFEDQNPGTTYYTVTGVANDPTMGYVLGSNRYEAGAEATLTAVANNGYRFVRWSNGETTATISFTVTENVELTAYFEVSTEGIEDVAAEATVFSTDNKIVVRGAEGQSIYVFDVNGRVMAREANAAESVEFRMETTGVYLVKVGTAAAKRVVVMR